MAGTSADGIDAAIIRVQGSGLSMRVRLVHHHHVPFPRDLRRRLLAVMAPVRTSTEELARLHALLGEAFAGAAAQAMGGVGRSERPSLIGLSGQTVCHLPNDRKRSTVTLQLGSPAHVAAIAGVPVVGDFRQSDVAVGGQGAPLVPWTDWVLFHDDHQSRAIQNIGGIGNVTWVPAGGGPEKVVAFDTGPGNMIIDEIVSRATDQRCRMDRDGRMAARGQVIESVLSAWLRHPFLRQSPPRTAGREEFGSSFVDVY
jgi:anhydro-N-acetylmuramic acid kinase